MKPDFFKKNDPSNGGAAVGTQLTQQAIKYMEGRSEGNIYIKLSLLPLMEVERKIVQLFLISLMVPLSMPIGPDWTRIYFWDFSLAAMYLFWFARSCSSRRQSYNLTFYEAAFVVFLLWLLLCDIMGSRPAVSLERWLLWVRGFLIFYYFSRNRDKVVTTRFFLKAIMLLVVAEGTLALFQTITQSNFGQINQYFGNFNPAKIPGFWYHGKKYIRASGTFFNTGLVAEWMVMLLPSVFSLYLVEDNDKKKIFMILSLFIGLVGALCTLSRTEIMAAVLGLVIVPFWHRKIRISISTISVRINRKLLRFFWLGCFILLAGLVLTYETGYLVKAFSRVSAVEKSVDVRMAYMIAAIQIINMRPFLGVGQGNFGLLLTKTDFSLFHRGEGVVHNIPLLIGCEAGYIGLLLFIGFVCLFIARFIILFRFKPSDDSSALTAGLLIGIICYFFVMQFGAGFIHHSILPLFCVISGLAIGKYRVKELYNG